MEEILRCKVVSKQWLSLIQSPCFSAAYTCHKMKEMAVAADNSSLVLNTNGRETASILTSPNIHSGNHSSRLSNFSIDFLPYQSYEDSLQYFELKVTDIYTADQNLFQLSRVDRCRFSCRSPTRTQVSTTRTALADGDSGTTTTTSSAPPTACFSARLSPATQTCTPSATLTPSSGTRFRFRPPDFSILAHIGFIVLDDDDRSFIIARIPLSMAPRRTQLDLEVLSSQSAEWTAKSAPLPRPLLCPDPDYSFFDDGSVNLAVNLHNRWLCWMLGGKQQVVLYDAVNGVVDWVIEPPRRTLDGICVSQGRLWAASLYGSTLTVFVAENLPPPSPDLNQQQRKPYFKLINRVSLTGPWDSLNPFIAQHFGRPDNPYMNKKIRNMIQGPALGDVFLTMNPHDSNQVYLTFHASFLALFHITQRTLKLLGGQGSLGTRYHLFICDNPSWPTPLPTLHFPPASSR
ncbi:unnamed protein product [Linum trigynum]|uniref:Uncharacterized protein n=1 Tax=Linum trigynum TaxID=586398 RepID=A0AAV2CNI2_9ROSI